jgi:ABC-2 type transport system ATP-binding protein
VNEHAIVAERLSKRFGPKWALQACDLDVPEGRVCALVGPNGAGKSTLLQLAAGLLRPSAGSIKVLGRTPAQDRSWLAGIGYLAQDVPLYRRLSAEQHLGMAAHLNPCWDDEFARGRLRELGIALSKPVGELSGGERVQVALAVALGKRPRLLLLDEPVASLDPLARHDFLSSLAEATAEADLTVVLSSHLIADIERVCDYLVILSASRVLLSGEVEGLLKNHKMVSGPRASKESISAAHEIVMEQNTVRQTSMLVRLNGSIHQPWWSVSDISLEELVLGYMRRQAPAIDRSQNQELRVLGDFR